MLTSTEEHDWTLRSCYSAEGTATLGVTIELRDDNGADPDSLFEGLRLRVTRLTNAAIHDEDSSIGLNTCLYLNHLIEEGSFLPVTTRCIYDNDLVFVLTEVGDTGLGNFYRVSLVLVTIERTLNFRRVHLQLHESTGTESISADYTNFPPFLHVMIGELGARRRLTSTLQANEHDDVRFSTLELVGLVVRRQHIGQLIDDGLLNDFSKLGGRLACSALRPVHLYCDLGFHRVSELADVVDVDIRGEQSRGDLSEELIEHSLINRFLAVKFAHGGRNLGAEVS